MRKIIGLLLTLSLAVGLLGAGLNAAFNLTGSATQSITLTATGIVISTTTPGATLSGNVVTCPPIVINVMVPSGVEVGSCNFTVAADPAGVAPSNVAVKFVSNAGFDTTKLTTKVTGATLPGALGLSTSPQPVVTTSSLPITISSQFSWGTFAADGAGTPLDPADGDGAPVFHTSFTITATP